MSENDRNKWERIYSDRSEVISQASRVMVENSHLLPQSGKALDVACGLGANAILMAKQGLETHAWDISASALQQLNQTIADTGLTIITEQRDIVIRPPEPLSFDVILVSRFLDRSLITHLIQALRPDGLIFYQTFTKTRLDGKGPCNPAYRLNNNELLQLFSALQLIVYREEGIVGDLSTGFRNEAMLIARQQSSGSFLTD